MTHHSTIVPAGVSAECRSERARSEDPTAYAWVRGGSSRGSSPAQVRGRIQEGGRFFSPPLRRPPKRPRAAFTLVEVMVAVAILALSLSAIFSTEAGAARMAHRSRKMGIAALLARCKMGEVEEQVAMEGLPALFDSGSDDCCADAEVDGFTCDWEIHPVVLPDTMFATDDEPFGPQGDPGAGPTPTDPASTGASGPTDPLANLAGAQPQDLLSGGGDLDGIASIALQQVYPILKPSFEAQIRRATITVHWKEGSTEHEFDVTQYLVSEQPIQGVTDDQAATTGTESIPGSVAPAEPPQ